MPPLKGYITVIVCLILCQEVILVSVKDVDALDGVPQDDACAEGYFRCSPVSQRCLAQYHWCDGHSSDCENGEDESIETCEPQGGFKGSFIRQNDEHITTAEPFLCDFDHVPEECACVFKNRLFCDSQHLTSLPAGMPNGTTRLQLTGNNIVMKPNMFAHLPALTHLYILNNSISTLPSDSFRGLTKLQRLMLDENEIERIESDTFADNQELIWIFLENNKINHIAPGTFEGLSQLQWLNLHTNRLNFGMHDVMPLNPNITYLELDRNELEYIGEHLFSEALHLEALFLSRNRIKYIHEHAFRHLIHLNELWLSDNRIASLTPKMFSANTLLENLNLGANPFHSLPLGVFSNLKKLNFLNLSAISIDNIDKGHFQLLPMLDHITFERFLYCHYAPNVRHCQPKSDGISSLENMLRLPLMRVCIWTVAVICLLGNIGVFLVRCLVTNDSPVHSIIIRNLCVCDLLMGIALIIMAVHDALYRDEYNQHALDWMHGWKCVGAGTLAVVSAQVSLSIVLFMSIERYVTITYPYKYQRLSIKGTYIALGFIWCTGIAMATVPLTSSAIFGEFYSINGVCMPLHIHNPYLQGWEYSAAVFLVLNSLCLIVVTYCYVAMFVNIVKTSHSVHRQILEDMVLAKRFVLIVLTDACCWLPIILIKILAFAHYPISNDCYAWVTILVLPLNSALNPVVYSLSTPFVTKKIAKWWNSEKPEMSTKNNSATLATPLDSRKHSQSSYLVTGGHSKNGLDHRGSRPEAAQMLLTVFDRNIIMNGPNGHRSFIPNCPERTISIED